jgi:HrpA-like RNA helicase
LSKLPVDVRIGKVILFGKVLRCIDPILTICAILTLGKSPFLSSPGSDNAVTYKQFMSEDSDLMTAVNAFNSWRFRKMRNDSSAEISSFCRSSFLNVTNLNMINDNRNQLIGILGLSRGTKKFQDDFDESINIYAKNYSMIASAIQAGLYPNLLVKDASVNGSKGGLHLSKTLEKVYIHPSSLLKLSTLVPGCYTFHSIQAKQSMQGKRSQGTVSDLSRVPISSIVAFSGTVAEYRHHDKRFIIDQNQVTIQMDRKDAGLFQLIRQEFKKVVLKVINGKPDKSEPLIGLIMQIADTEVSGWK